MNIIFGTSKDYFQSINSESILVHLQCDRSMPLKKEAILTPFPCFPYEAFLFLSKVLVIPAHSLNFHHDINRILFLIFSF